MKKFLVVTIDTETDSPRWGQELPQSLKNINNLPKVQNLFDKYKLKPTYLVTYPVVTDRESQGILRSILAKGKAEIGSHLHPAVTPPFAPGEKEKSLASHPHLSELEKEKLITLTKAIEESFGIKPKSYRAGKYGFDQESLGYLEELDYLVDSSITPNINWSFEDGIDFSHFGRTEPYFLNKKDLSETGNSSILEVPISIAITGLLPERLKFWYNNLPYKLKQFLRKMNIIKTIWLRPSISSFEEMKCISDYFIEKGNKVLNMMFHSNELMAGTSPYIKTGKEAENFFRKLDEILNYLVIQKKLESKTLSELPNSIKIKL